MIELEKTFLAKYLPEGLRDCEQKDIIDVYLPKSSPHPKLRLRKNGDKYELTKKEPVQKEDASRQNEQTIILTKQEFDDLNRQIEGKIIHKTRYLYNHDGKTAEFDVFKDQLTGLVLIDFEFTDLNEKNKFTMPDFCLVDITQEDFIAGGMLCGKTYADIQDNLNRFSYNSLFLQ